MQSTWASHLQLNGSCRSRMSRARTAAPHCLAVGSQVPAAAPRMTVPALLQDNSSTPADSQDTPVGNRVRQADTLDSPDDILDIPVALLLASNCSPRKRCGYK